LGRFGVFISFLMKSMYCCGTVNSNVFKSSTCDY
jgi:hypothetical protein